MPMRGEWLRAGAREVRMRGGYAGGEWLCGGAMREGSAYARGGHGGQKC